MSRMSIRAALAASRLFSLSMSANSRLATSASVWTISRAAIRPAWINERLVWSCFLARARDSRLISISRLARITARYARITEVTTPATVSRRERTWIFSSIRATRTGAVSTSGPKPFNNGCARPSSHEPAP